MIRRRAMFSSNLLNRLKLRFTKRKECPPMAAESFPAHTEQNGQRPSQLSCVMRVIEERAENIPGGSLFHKGQYRLRVAADLESRKKAYALVYRLYLEKGYARPDPSRMWLSAFDAIPETTTFLVERVSDNEAAGALTVVFDSSVGLPADNVYAAELNLLRNSGRRLAEITSLGVAENGTKGPEILARLLNHAYLLARKVRGATDFVVTVNPRHVPFYERLLLFAKAGPEREYGKVGGAPAVLLYLSLSVVEQEIRLAHSSGKAQPVKSRTLYPMSYPETEEDPIVAEIRRNLHPLPVADFHRLFLDETDALKNAAPGIRTYLRERYHASRQEE